MDHLTYVLAIQSHVVHGHAGNSAASFPMQLLGLDVDTFNILSFSNHTGYFHHTGHKISKEQFNDLAKGLLINDFLFHYKYIVTGYIGQTDLIESACKLVHDAKEGNRKLILNLQKQPQDEQEKENKVVSAMSQRPLAYVCDPVLGDAGQLYVSEDCVQCYKNDVLPLADIVVPNYFEASVLSGVSIKGVTDAVKAANWFHAAPRNIKTVVIKQFQDLTLCPEDTHLFLLVSTAAADGTSHHCYILKVKKLEGYFVGTGDSFLAMFLGHYNKLDQQIDDEAIPKILGVKFHGSKFDENMVNAVQRATAGIAQVLMRTECYRKVAAVNSTHTGQVGREGIDFSDKELTLVHSQKDILLPDVSLVTVKNM